MIKKPKRNNKMSVEEVNERWATWRAALKESPTALDIFTDAFAAEIASKVIERYGDDIPPDLLEKFIAIRDGNESCAT